MVTSPPSVNCTTSSYPSSKAVPSSGLTPVASTRTSCSSAFQRIVAVWTGSTTLVLSARFARILYSNGNPKIDTTSRGKQRKSVNPVFITNSIAISGRFGKRKGTETVACLKVTIPEITPSLAPSLHRLQPQPCIRSESQKTDCLDSFYATVELILCLFCPLRSRLFRYQ